MTHFTKNRSVTPLHDKILFKFTDPLTKDGFMPKTRSGIMVTDFNTYQEIHKPKWGEVLSCGVEVNQEIAKSKYILVEPGKWTLGINFDDDRFWQTEESFILATADDEAVTYRY
jgi:co-chaperonin GroES (HSP10)